MDCPHCGAEFLATRPSCPECGSDCETGWSEDGLTGYASTDIPDAWDEEAYQESIRGLPGGPPADRPRTRRQWVLLIVAVIAVVAILFTVVLH